MNLSRAFFPAASFFAFAALCALSLRAAPPEKITLDPISPALVEQFPYEIPITLWPASEGFRRGDRIVIASVRGDRPRIEPGGTYLVEGTYTLLSAPEATLALSLTARYASQGRSSWAPTQSLKIAQGDGRFSLIATMRVEGDYHVSFYVPTSPDAQGRTRSTSQGGLYFQHR